MYDWILLSHGNPRKRYAIDPSSLHSQAQATRKQQSVHYGSLGVALSAAWQIVNG